MCCRGAGWRAGSPRVANSRGLALRPHRVLPDSRSGVCLLLLPLLQASGIVPMAYFPLSGEELGSITLPALNGTNVGELAWVDDAKFARVPNCEKVRAQSQGGPRRQAGGLGAAPAQAQQGCCSARRARSLAPPSSSHPPFFPAGHPFAFPACHPAPAFLASIPSYPAGTSFPAGQRKLHHPGQRALRHRRLLCHQPVDAAPAGQRVQRQGIPVPLLPHQRRCSQPHVAQPGVPAAGTSGSRTS